MPEDVNALLNAYLDGRLDAGRSAKVAKLLKKPAVARRLARMRSLCVHVREAAPRPSPEQSQRMWAGIRARVAVQAPAVARGAAEIRAVTPLASDEAWYAFLTRPWVRGWGLGLAGAAAALTLVLLIYPRPARLAAPSRSEAQAPVVSAQGGSGAVSAGPGVQLPAPARISKPAGAAPALASARREPVHSRGPLNAPPAAAQPAPVLAGLPAPGFHAPSSGTTEVERALADNQVDATINQILAARQQAPGSMVAQLEISPRAQVEGPATVGFRQSDAPVQDDGVKPGPPGPVQGGKDANGFWDWKPTAMAMNGREWPQAQVELEAASGKAGASAERAFADSALTLLSGPGAPLEGAQPGLPPIGDLRVLEAGAWQLEVQSRLARFTQGVSVRIPGYRADGDSMLLDMTFDRAVFAPGAHFTRVSGEAPARVVDAANQQVSADDFYAPNGADYNIPDKELRLH